MPFMEEPEEPLSPHHGEIITASLPFLNKQRTKHFFEEDQNPVHAKMKLPRHEYENQFSTISDEEERDDIRLLGSADSDTNLSFDFDRFQEETIFEPSFEVALMDSSLSGSVEDATTATRQSSMAGFHNKEGRFPALSNKLHHSAQKRYDCYGRPFVHIFHEGLLPTLYEEEEEESQDCCNDEQCGSPAGPDEARIRARWELALEQMSNTDCACEWDGIIPQKHGNRSNYEI